MTNATFTQALEALSAEREDVIRQLDVSRSETARLARRDDALRAAIESLQALTTPEPDVFDEEVESRFESDRVGQPADEQATMNGSHSSNGGSSPTPRRRKIRSTQIVKDFLRRAEGPIERSGVLAYFQSAGLTENWQEPENALNTAIIRAIKSGDVIELTDGRLVHRESQASAAQMSGGDSV